MTASNITIPTSVSMSTPSSVTCSTEYDKSPCESHFEEKGNNLKVLFSMLIGLKNTDGSLIGFGKNPSKKSRYTKPTNKDLMGEMRGRKNVINDSTVTNTQWKYESWLVENPVTNESCIAFIKNKYMESYNAAENEKNNTEYGRCQWSGVKPYLCLIHCIVDVDENKEAFFESFTVLGRLEVDGHNDPSSARPDVWDMAAVQSMDFFTKILLKRLICHTKKLKE